MTAVLSAALMQVCVSVIRMHELSDQLNFGILVIRVVFGLFLVAHGYNKVFGAGGLSGTAGWFASMGMKWPKWQARLAAATEIGAGLLFALGLLTPLAAAAMVSLMIVAIVTVHGKVGFFIFKPGGGWEYCASIIAAAFAIGAMGAGNWSLDHALEIEFTEWTGALVAGGVGVLGAVLQLASSYRPPASKA